METDYKDWLAAHGLLELKSSPGKDDILEAKYRERKAALNNLHWSLNAIYKFIDINEFTQIEHEEIENKLQEILDSLKLKLVHEDPVICKIEERGEDKKDSVRKEEQAKRKDGGNHNISVICKTEENNTEKVENKEREKKEDNGMKTDSTDVVKAENKESEKKEDNGMKAEGTDVVKVENRESEKKEDNGKKAESTEVVKTVTTKSSIKDEKKTKLQGAVSVTVKGIRKIDKTNKDKENKEEQAVEEKSGVTLKWICKIKNESAVTEDRKEKDVINEDGDKANRKSVSFAEKVEECVPIVKISETVTEQNIVDKSLFEVDTEEETDSETEDIPSSQMKAENCMVDYKSQTSSTDEYDEGNSQESYDGDEVVWVWLWMMMMGMTVMMIMMMMMMLTMMMIMRKFMVERTLMKCKLNFTNKISDNR